MNRDTFNKAKDIDAQMERLKIEIKEMRVFQTNIAKQSKICILKDKVTMDFNNNGHFINGIQVCITNKERELEALQKEFVYLV